MTWEARREDWPSLPPETEKRKSGRRARRVVDLDPPASVVPAALALVPGADEVARVRPSAVARVRASPPTARGGSCRRANRRSATRGRPERAHGPSGAPRPIITTPSGYASNIPSIFPFDLPLMHPFDLPPSLAGSVSYPLRASLSLVLASSNLPYPEPAVPGRWVPSALLGGPPPDQPLAIISLARTT